jgi:hypothetical protein
MNNTVRPSRMAWQRLPTERRRKLSVLIGHLARRQMEAGATAEEDCHERHDPNSDGQDPQPSP